MRRGREEEEEGVGGKEGERRGEKRRGGRSRWEGGGGKRREAEYSWHSLNTSIDQARLPPAETASASVCLRVRFMLLL